MIRTAEEVLKEFRLRGISINGWAQRNGFNPTLVYRVLRSKKIPTRGQSHRIAVMLGLKEGLLDQEINLMSQVSGGDSAKN